jgi:glucose-1-phosphate adenylyltransferase
VLSPGVFVSPGAVVRESVIMNDTFIGPGAVLDRVVVDKQVVVSSGVRLGDGDGLNIPNAEMPSKLDSGITVVGKGAYIPANVRIGRNVLIDADVSEEAFGSTLDVPDGASVHRDGIHLPPEPEPEPSPAADDATSKEASE